MSEQEAIDLFKDTLTKAESNGGGVCLSELMTLPKPYIEIMLEGDGLTLTQGFSLGGALEFMELLALAIGYKRRNSGTKITITL